MISEEARKEKDALAQLGLSVLKAIERRCKRGGQMECEVNGLSLGLSLVFSSPMSCVLR